MTARERRALERHLRALDQAREAGLTGLRDVWTSGA